jgi:hypothetical protein
MQQRIASDPEGGTLHGIMKHATLVSLSNPLIKAILQQDTQILGELGHSEFAKNATERKLDANRLLLETLRAQGVIRTDIDLDTSLHMLMSIVTGFCLIDQFLPEHYQFSPERIAEMTAESVRRTFEIRDATQPEQHAVTETFSTLIEQLRQQSEKELGL